MSVAFVKEPNEDQVEVLPDRDLGKDPNLVTERGMALLDEALERDGERLEAARAAGDKIAMAALNRDLRYWRTRRATAELVLRRTESDVVQFASTVSIERDDGRRQTFRIVGIDEADPSRGLVSYVSPLARALVGKTVGDLVKAGGGEAEIVAIDL